METNVTKLSDHFTLYELTKSATAERLGIQNIPQADEISSLMLICVSILEPVRKKYGIPYSPNSGFRCQKLNTAIGSKPTSQHTKGQAVDIEVPGIANYDLASWICETLMFDQIILEHYKLGEPNSGWVHVSLKQYDNRQQALTFNSGRYLQGLMA